MESGGNAEYLLDYAAGKLNAGAREQMARHLETCAACREFAGGQRAVWEALDDWQPTAISPDFDRRLFARIEQEPVSWWKRLTAPLHHAVPIGATAAVLVVAGVLMLRPWNVPTPVADAPKSARVVEQLQPEQVDQALDQMEMLRDLNHLVKPDSTEPKM